MDEILSEVEYHLAKRLVKHGDGLWGKHQAFGVVAEEFYESVEALRDPDPKRFYDEMMDIVVAGLWALKSLKVYESTD